jgi:hypothetical protein
MRGKKGYAVMIATGEAGSSASMESPAPGSAFWSVNRRHPACLSQQPPSQE